MDRMSGSVSSIRQNPVIFQISKISGYVPIFKNRISGFRISRLISGKPDIIKTFYYCLKIWDVSIIWATLSNNKQALKYPVSGWISGVRHPPDIRLKIRYPLFRMAGYPAKLPSGPSLQIPIILMTTSWLFCEKVVAICI